MKRLKDSVAAAIAWRCAAHAAMVAMALWNESRAALQLPDLVLARVPKVEWLARHNYQLWVLAWVPLAILLLLRDRPRFIRFMGVGGWLSLVQSWRVPQLFSRALMGAVAFEPSPAPLPASPAPRHTPFEPPIPRANLRDSDAAKLDSSLEVALTPRLRCS